MPPPGLEPAPPNFRQLTLPTGLPEPPTLEVASLQGYLTDTSDRPPLTFSAEHDATHDASQISSVIPNSTGRGSQ